jgi:signal transduction histidine kinase
MFRRLRLTLEGLPRKAIGKTLGASTAIFFCIMGAAYWAAHNRRSADEEEAPLVDLLADAEFAASTLGLAAVLTAAISLAIFVLLHRTIAPHMQETAALANQNLQLKRALELARSETSAEHILGRIGQELHDGPIQLLSILSLKLFEPHHAESRHTAAAGAHDLLTSAIDDLRKISLGLVLPELDGLTTAETLLLAVSQHQIVTGTSITSDIGDLPSCSAAQRKCLYRVVREALNNSYRHADGNGQVVRASANSGSITVIVSDSGADRARPGYTPYKANREPTMGLDGLRRSVEQLNGSFEVRSQSDGTLVSATIPVTT